MSQRAGRPGGTDFEYYKAVGRTSELTTRQKLVAIIIRNHWSPKEIYNPSNALIAKMAGCTTRTVQKDLAALQKLGWLRKQERVGTTNVYTPWIPDDYIDVRDSPPTAASPSPASAVVEGDALSPAGGEQSTDPPDSRPRLRIEPAVAPSPSPRRASPGTPPSPQLPLSH